MGDESKAIFNISNTPCHVERSETPAQAGLPTKTKRHPAERMLCRCLSYVRHDRGRFFYYT